MLTDAETQTTPPRRRSPKAHDVAFGAGHHRVPARLVLRVPKIIVVVVHGEREEVLGPGLLVQVHQVFRVPLVCGEQRNGGVFVPELAGGPEAFDVIPVLRMALDVHPVRVPIAIADRRLRPPVRPDAELGVGEPVRDRIGLKRLAARGEVAARASGVGLGGQFGEASPEPPGFLRLRRWCV